MKKVLITGAAGFIGSHLCDRFIKEGFYVIGLDSFLTGSPDNIAHLIGNERFKFIKYDVTNFIYIPDEIDIILHFACPASPVDYLNHPIHTMKVDSLGTINTLGLAKAKKARYIFASTSEVYGDPKVHPQPETYWGNVNPIGPRGVYDEAKRFAEALTLAYHRAHDLPVRVVRIFNTYGPHLRPADGRVVSNFLVQAMDDKPLTIYGAGTQTRSFCYVDDEVRGILALLDSDYVGPVNIGNPIEFSVAELAETVLDVTGSSSSIVYEPLPVDDPTRRRPDISLAERVLGWRPEIDLREGLARTYAWYAEERRRGRA